MRPLHRARRHRAERAGAMAVRDMLPVALSVAPFGLVVGVSLAALSLPPAAALLDTMLIFGGSAQLSATTLLAAGAGAVPVLGTVLVIQARLLLYGAALEPLFRAQPALFRWLGPATIVDQTFALAMARHEQLREPTQFRRYWLSACAVLIAVWMAAVAVGGMVGPALPTDTPLTVAVPAIFVGLLIPQLRSRPGVAAAVVGGGVAAVASPLPHGLGLLVGVAAGVGAGWLTQRWAPAPVAAQPRAAAEA